MLPSDNQAAARPASEMFTDRRVAQYWDADRASGVAYSRDVFPGAWRELLSHLPEDSPIRSHIERGAEADPARRPMWDFAAFYPAGVRWGESPPSPESFIRQLAMFRTEDGSTRALLVTDSFAKPPVESDWFDEVRVKTASLLGRDVAAATRTGRSPRGARVRSGRSGARSFQAVGARRPGGGPTMRAGRRRGVRGRRWWRERGGRERERAC